MASDNFILCLDDDEILRRMYSRGLGSIATVVAVQDGNAALNLLGKDAQHYSLIFTDNNMQPGMGGLEFLAQARQYGIPTFMVSTPVDITPVQLHEKVKELGGKGLIEKPFDLSFLKTVATEIMTGGLSPRYGLHAREKRYER